MTEDPPPPPNPEKPDNYPVDQVGFSERALRFLEKHNLKTVGEVSAKSKKELKEMGANQKTIIQIDDGLKEVGRKLRQDS